MVNADTFSTVTYLNENLKGGYHEKDISFSFSNSVRINPDDWI